MHARCYTLKNEINLEPKLHLALGQSGKEIPPAPAIPHSCISSLASNKAPARIGELP